MIGKEVIYRGRRWLVIGETIQHYYLVDETFGFQTARKSKVKEVSGA
ncbi:MULTISPECIES: hypothetical protein [Thermoactinomyces]|uniref:Uncharacterized protein n=1 Tax=Thermoactinomyces daqus TaxID=1329516 RepID=A0A7W2AHP7_9BACL|nr:MULTISPECIES: hypothetical protein [Thermoactinomyces]MBA4543432.1 hypothetical protein [Thermoactinomyces daqus]MBH8606025.1 hypothetical protein [Thermoactinomyces sp. CICC 10521]